MIRPARPEDAPAIAALLNHWILTSAITFNPVPKTAEEIAAQIAAKAAAGHGYFVAVEGDGTVLGQASYGQFRAGAGYATCMEHSISLAPDRRGGGIGRALMAAVEDHARRAGAHQMIAGVSAENPEAGPSTNGWATSGSRPFPRRGSSSAASWTCGFCANSSDNRRGGGYGPAIMSIWTRIADALAALAKGEPLSLVFDRLRGAPAPDQSVGFTIAVLALGAKMAKADGTVTRDEVTAFRRIFTFPPGEENHAARVFDLARQDVAGFDAYARKIARLFNPGGQRICADDHHVLVDVLEALFQIAIADGSYHAGEDAFLTHVAQEFGLDESCFRVVRARLVEGAPRDPYDVLGLPRDASLAAARKAWKDLVRDTHPDVMQARGVPPEAMKLAERRLQLINEAWKAIAAKEAA